jgi:UDP-N-acetylglucosamine 2-epimerase (non-hydrolysing)
MNKKLKILIVFGTRPEVIKLAPVIKELNKHKDHFDPIVCVTGQHRQMIDSLLKLFEIEVDYDLNLMKENQNLEHITTTVLQEMGQIIDKEQCDYLMVQGDTTSAMAAGLAAFYKKVKIAHVEAGLRTWNLQHPFPEEANRRIIDSIADLFFAHTDKAKENLLNEGVDPAKIEVTGNTVIDALLDTVGRKFEDKHSIINKLSLNGRKTILMTAHRRENFGGPIQAICEAVKQIAVKYKDSVDIVYPVHLNPNIKDCVQSILGDIDNVKLTKPLDYLEFVHLMKKSYLILTDSGGLQEEAPSLGKPVLVLRETTERPEGVDAGCVKIIGTDVRKTVEAVSLLLDDPAVYEQMAKAVNPYGDGKASQRIVQRFLKERK